MNREQLFHVGMETGLFCALLYVIYRLHCRISELEARVQTLAMRPVMISPKPKKKAPEEELDEELERELASDNEL